jgi:hypothetical protein
MLAAVEYLGSVGIGVTLPHFFRADDGQKYVVKLQNNRLGSKVLVSEYLASKLGKIMGLCFPPSDIIIIDEELLEQNPCLAEAGAMPGRHFASQYLDSTTYVIKHNIDKASNFSEMAGVILFDHMFHNADRAANRRNLLLREEGNDHKIYAIDNSHLFRSGNWTLDSLISLGPRLKLYYKYSFGILLRERLSPEDFCPYMEKVKNLSDDYIDMLVGEIPNEWLANKDEQQALANFIKLRRDMVDEIWKELCNQIPKNHGGRNWHNSRCWGIAKKEKN